MGEKSKVALGVNACDGNHTWGKCDRDDCDFSLQALADLYHADVVDAYERISLLERAATRVLNLLESEVDIDWTETVSLLRAALREPVIPRDSEEHSFGW